MSLDHDPSSVVITNGVLDSLKYFRINRSLRSHVHFKQILGWFMMLAASALLVFSSFWCQLIFNQSSFTKPFFLSYVTFLGYTIWNFGYIFSHWRSRLVLFSSTIAASECGLRMVTPVPSHIPQDQSFLAARIELENEERSLISSNIIFPLVETSYFQYGGGGSFQYSEEFTQPRISDLRNNRSFSELQQGETCRLFNRRSPEINSSFALIRQKVYSVIDLAKISLILAPLWFFCSYFANLSLMKTSMTSYNALGSTSLLWTLLLTIFVESSEHALSHWLLLGIVLGCSGAIMIGFSDNADTTHANAIKYYDVLIGDFYVLLSAVLYSVSVVFMVWSFSHTKHYSMGMIMGMIGIFGMIIALPFGYFLHYFKFEIFEFPSLNTLILILINSFLFSNISQFLFCECAVLTSPLLVNIGIGLTTPLSMIFEVTIQNKSFSLLYYMGSFLIVCSFFFGSMGSTENLSQ